jgi:F-type H+-transporting ATPase subunit b
MKLRRSTFLGAMVLVTAWSIWAWAEPKGGHEHSAAAEHHEAAEEAGPAPMNWVEFGGETPPFIASVVNFAILVAGYYLLGRKPIAAALKGRRDSIAKEIEDAQRMRREAEERAKTYQAKLEHLQEEVRAAQEALVRTGEAERDRIVAEADAKAERMRADATFLVEQEIKQIRQDLWRDALETAVTAAEQLLAHRVTGTDHERLAEDYLADLGPKPKAERTSESVRPQAPETRSPS